MGPRTDTGPSEPRCGAWVVETTTTKRRLRLRGCCATQVVVCVHAGVGRCRGPEPTRARGLRSGVHGDPHGARRARARARSVGGEARELLLENKSQKITTP